MSEADEPTIHEAVRFDSNVDDLDPRLWPYVIDRLLEAGAQDAWVTPIVMKKGRPAFTVSALCDRTCAEAVRDVLFRETSTIGVRESVVRKHVLARRTAEVEVDGRRIGVKTATLHGEVVNRSVEWDDVAAASAALGLSAKQVLDAARAAAASTPDDA